MVRYEKLTPPSSGGVIRFENGQPVVPDNPIVPFIRGDGTGVDIWPATQKVIDAAIAKARRKRRPATAYIRNGAEEGNTPAVRLEMLKVGSDNDGGGK